MSETGDREVLIDNFARKANEALVDAERVLAMGSAGLATNRIYYACFYAVTAVLMRMGFAYGRHAAVKRGLHEHLLATGIVPRDWGVFYEKAMYNRHEADYNALATFDAGDITKRLELAKGFVKVILGLLDGSRADNKET